MRQVTYNLHIMLRFDQTEFNEESTIKLPDAWQADSGITNSPDDRDGVLQDVHSMQG
jgi:Zn-dependent M32 family carboxypeptidase